MALKTEVRSKTENKRKKTPPRPNIDNSGPRTYRGRPATQDAPACVFVSRDGYEERFRANMPFTWGDGHYHSALLALTLVRDVTGDADLTQRVYRRFLHRVVAQWRANEPWIMREHEIREHVADILKVEAESAPLRRMVATAPRPVVSEGGADVEWDKRTPDRFGR